MVAQVAQSPGLQEFAMLFDGSQPTGVETELVSQDSPRRDRGFYIQAVSISGANLRFARITGPPATFFAQSLHFLGKRDQTTQFVRQELRMQMFVPRDTDLSAFTFQDGLGVEDNDLFIHCTYQPDPNKQIGFMYSQLQNLTIGAGSDDYQIIAPEISVPSLGFNPHTLIAGQYVGRGITVFRASLTSSRWGSAQTDVFVGSTDPGFMGAVDNFSSDGPERPTGTWVLAEQDTWITRVISATGDSDLVTYWHAPAVSQAAGNGGG